jgi:site-specific DNA-cytosine methylase
MNVLSLFDGISCCRLALDRSGIAVDNYYASEIDKYAIMVAQNKLPNRIPNDLFLFRYITPLECERLQTLPDNWTQCVSNSQRYKMIGNAWTVDVVAHLFRDIAKIKGS